VVEFIRRTKELVNTMHTTPDFFARTANAPAQKKPTLFDVITKLLLPSLTLAAFVLGQIKGVSPRIEWALFTGTIVLAMFGFAFVPLSAKVRRMREQSRDTKATLDALPELTRLARTFSEFVSNGRQDTLQAIYQAELCQHRGDLLAVLPIQQFSIWYRLAHFFDLRVERLTSDPRELQTALQEFHNLVGSYSNCYVTPIFERFPDQLKSALTPRVRSSLNGFQLRFVLFLKEYEDFVKQLEITRPVFSGLPYMFVIPKAL
jgi:hypothetical protein